MQAPLSPTLTAACPPPVMEARRWVAGRTFPADRPLLNLSQAAPVDAPPEALRQAMAQAVLEDPGVHLYGHVLGDMPLREAVARRWSEAYDGTVAAEQVAITAGCNQAFCAAVASVAAPGEAVMLPTPWYFNHKMWLDMAGMQTVTLPCGVDGLPAIADAAARLTPKVKAIVLVTPNNPTGAEYPPALVSAFADLCSERGLALILDETYRDFHSESGTPHDLLRRADWTEMLIQLYSFSKVYRLTGHRVGAMVSSAARIAQVEKFLDTVTICPNRLGQVAALHGLAHLGDWVAAERTEVLHRRAVVERAFAQGVGGWKLRSVGAYFAFLEHPFAADSDAVAKALVDKANLLVLPSTMFAPRRAEGGNGDAERTLRLAFANADADGLETCVSRLRAFSM